MRLIIFINQEVSQLLVCPIFPKNWTVLVLLLQKIIMILKNHFWMLWQLGVFGIDKKELKNKKTPVNLVNARQLICLIIRDNDGMEVDSKFCTLSRLLVIRQAYLREFFWPLQVHVQPLLCLDTYIHQKLYQRLFLLSPLTQLSPFLAVYARLYVLPLSQQAAKYD